MVNASDEDVRKAVHDFLMDADLGNVNPAIIKNFLENKFDWDLSARLDIICDAFSSFMEKLLPDGDDDEVSDKNVDNQHSSSESESDDESILEEEDIPRKRPMEKKKTGLSQQKLEYSSSLAQFMEKSFGPRTEVIKKLWDHIKANNLQNPQDKREILCDDILKEIFKCNKMTMFKMNKLLTKHIKKAEELQPIKQEIEEDDEEGTDDDEEGESEKPRPKKQKIQKKIKKDKVTTKKREPNENNAFMKKLKLSPQLSAFLGGIAEESRPQVVKKLWEYIKTNGLQRQDNKQYIQCDAALKKIFKVDEIHMFTMNRLLKEQNHLT